MGTKQSKARRAAVSRATAPGITNSPSESRRPPPARLAARAPAPRPPSPAAITPTQELSATLRAAQAAVAACDWHTTRALYERVVELQNAAGVPDGKAYNNLGFALLQLRQLQHARAAIERGIQLQEARHNAPLDGQQHRNLGQVLLMVGDLERAQATFELAIELQAAAGQLDGRAHMGLGRVLIRQRRIAQAHAALQRGMELAPNDPRGPCGLGDVLRLQQICDMDGARRRYEEALVLDPAHALAHSGLGHVLLHEERDFAAAKREFELALQAPDSLTTTEFDPDTHLGLACALKGLGEPARAIAPFARAAELHATDPPTPPTTRGPRRRQILPSEVADVRRVGGGAMGDVFLSTFRDRPVACKRLRAQHAEAEECVGLWEAEAQALEAVRDPNVIGFLGASYDPTNLFVVMEYAERGSLADLLFDNGERLPGPMQFRLLRDVARGLLALHKNEPQVLHRDLKAKNVLISQDWHAKIADFGLATMATTSAGSRWGGSGVGTVPFKAPELFDDAPCTPASDVFAFAVVVYEVVVGDPWRCEPDSPAGISEIQIMRKVDRGERPTMPDEMDPFFKQLVADCWAQEPAGRPSMTEVLQRFQGAAQHYEFSGSEAQMLGGVERRLVELAESSAKSFAALQDAVVGGEVRIRGQMRLS